MRRIWNHWPSWTILIAVASALLIHMLGWAK